MKSATVASLAPVVRLARTTAGATEDATRGLGGALLPLSIELIMK